MKPKLILLLICVSGFLFAGGVEKSWYIAVNDYSFSPTHLSPTWETYCLKTSGDTLIGGLDYQKLLKYESVKDKGTYNGALRMDSNRVYHHTNEKEFLIYDFNLEVGDSTTSIYRGDYLNLLTVVDSVSYTEVNGTQLKTMHVKYFSISEYGNNFLREGIWVETIGSIKYGLLYIRCLGTTGCHFQNYLTCYYENDSHLWENPDFNDCWIDVGNKTFPLKKEQPKWKTINTLTTYPEIITTKEYEIVKDTVIDYYHYYKLSNEGGYYRISGNKVYYKLNETDKDYLLYDFDLELNDTVTCGLDLNNSETVNEARFWVEEIDSIKCEDGMHKRLRI